MQTARQNRNAVLTAAAETQWAWATSPPAATGVVGSTTGDVSVATTEAPAAGTITCTAIHRVAGGTT